MVRHWITHILPITGLLSLIGGSALATDSKTLQFVERESRDVVTDLGDKGDTAGDLLTFNNQVFDSANANAVGSTTGWCIRVVAGKSWACTSTVTLADGQIMVEGPVFDGGDSTIAVTGGTGAYSEARGEMKLHPRDAKGSEYDLSFSLR